MKKRKSKSSDNANKKHSPRNGIFWKAEIEFEEENMPKAKKSDPGKRRPKK